MRKGYYQLWLKLAKPEGQEILLDTFPFYVDAHAIGERMTQNHATRYKGFRIIQEG